MFQSVLILAIVSLLGGPSSASDTAAPLAGTTGAPACPSDIPEVRGRVARLISSPAAASIRLRDGWGGVDASNLRVLTDAADAEACRWLREAAPLTASGRGAVYYAADGFYFVGTYRLEYQVPGTLRLGGWHPVLVFRADRTLAGSYAS